MVETDPEKFEDWQTEDPGCLDRLTPPGPTTDKQAFRIEALRAASRVVAGAVTLPTGAINVNMKWNGKEVTLDQWTLLHAERFAKWLEDGKTGD